jgi:hypothetical protein
MPDGTPSDRTIAAIVPRLANSLRGQIFLCNLEAALQIPLIDERDLCAALRAEADESTQLKDEDSLLGYLKRFLQNAATVRWHRRATLGVPDEFSPDAPLVTVIKADDYRYYRDSEHTAANHNFETPGWTINRIGIEAVTPEYFWAAPGDVCVGQSTDKKPRAEFTRDRLGLVHYGKNVALLALFLRPPASHPWCRPTVLEASPNARFRQVHPEQPETRWGFTVDLAKLDSPSAGSAIAGVPELVIGQVNLNNCTAVEFVALGKTESDRATAESDRQFLHHVRGERDFEDVYSKLAALLNTPSEP